MVALGGGAVSYERGTPAAPTSLPKCRTLIASGVGNQPKPLNGVWGTKDKPLDGYTYTRTIKGFTTLIVVWASGVGNQPKPRAAHQRQSDPLAVVSLPRSKVDGFVPVIDSGRGTTRAEDAQGTPT